MTQDGFVRELEELANLTAKATIENLRVRPGREPLPGPLRRHVWYRNLSTKDRALVEEVVKETVRATIFGWCVELDGNSGKVDRVTGVYELWFQKGEETVLLNDRRLDPLHPQVSDFFEEIQLG